MELSIEGKNDWDTMPDQSQALAILRRFKTTGEVIEASSSNPIAKLVERYLQASKSAEIPVGLVRESNKIIQNWLTDQFNDLPIDEPIIAIPLVPFCLSPRDNVQSLFHCEARFQADRDENRRAIKRHIPLEAECPRLGKVLCKKRVPGYSHGFSRIEPNLGLESDDWSLLELFALNRVTPDVIEQAFQTQPGEGDEAVNRLSGEINRLNEIRSRCKCRRCMARLQFSRRYSTKDAVYRSTVTLPCSTNSCDGPSVYFNHCRGCRMTIDSRDSIFKDSENFYICIHCASGNDLERAGSVCPKCGSANSLRGNFRKKQCKVDTCNHKVELPTSARRAKYSSQIEEKYDKTDWPNDKDPLSR